MSKLDAKKETISFLTKLFFVLVGVNVVAMSELISMLRSENIDMIFWLGILSVFILSFGCLLVFKHIQKNIKEIEEL